MTIEGPADSKSFAIAKQAITYVFIVFGISSIVNVALGVTLPYVAETLAAIVGIAGVNTARNILVDGPARRATVISSYGPPAAGPTQGPEGPRGG